MASVTRPRSGRLKRRAEIEAAVLAATERLLADGASFTELGVQRIAAEAGVARSSFYMCFPDKVTVLVRLVGSMKDELFGKATEWRPTGPDGGVDGLAAVFARQLAFYRLRAPLLAAINEVSTYDPTLREATAQEINRFVQHATEVLEEEQRAGRIPADIDPVVSGKVLTWGGAQVIAQQIAMGDPDGDSVVALELARSQWYGTYRRGAGPA
ncbi:TetR/AcrR family transcriptional regulator [Streptomyces sp. NPDC093544]|jgi:AcrR family transcriptional regulator|uniref:TetR/AcrR family transcriptional regulator n=1 Tax=Streptomyces sp. NPDC093544 TaxID=3155200 RepID=UPI003413BFEB